MLRLESSSSSLCREQGGAGFGRLALRRLPLASGHAPGSPELRPSSANQPEAGEKALFSTLVVEPGHRLGALEHMWWERATGDVRTTHRRCKPAGRQVLHSVVFDLWRRRSHLGVALEPTTAWGAVGQSRSLPNQTGGTASSDGWLVGWRTAACPAASSSSQRPPRGALSWCLVKLLLWWGTVLVFPGWGRCTLAGRVPGVAPGGVWVIKGHACLIDRPARCRSAWPVWACPSPLCNQSMVTSLASNDWRH